MVHNYCIHYQHVLFNSLAGRGLDLVVLYTALWGRSRCLPVSLEDSAYRYVAGHHGSYEDVRPAAAAARVWAALTRLRPRRLIVSGWCDAAAWSAWLWGRTHEVPMVLWCESNAFDHRRRGWREQIKRQYVRRFGAAHTYGQSSRQYLVDLGFPTDRIFTGRAVVDTRLFRPALVPRPMGSRRTLLFVGRLAPEKNLAVALEALSRIPQDARNPRLVLRVAGSGPLESQLRSTVARLGLEPFVHFGGPATQLELPAIYSSADALVLPSTSEPWGLVVNEAMCCGIPAIVSSRCGCAADLVTPATGWAFEPHDAARLAAIFEEIASMPRRTLAGMGDAARRLAVRYSPERGASAILECLNSLP